MNESLLLADAVRRLAAAGIDSPRLDARLLWEYARTAASFESLLARRLAREPLAYITGRKEFWSLEFEVGPGVLVPRPDTETVVEQALVLWPDRSAPLRLLDFGTGSGCLLAALLKEFPNTRGLGVDCSEQACGYAQRNLERLDLAGRGEIRRGNWGEGIDGPFDLIVSNPPYIKAADIPALAPEVSRYEPVLALDGGPDGLAAFRVLAHELKRLLSPQGHALIEIGAGQGEGETASVMTQGRLKTVRIAPDLAGIPRVLVVEPGP